MHALMCALRTDGKIRPFDVSSDGPGQPVAGGTEQRPPESWGPNPGAASVPPPLSLSSPRSSDQYRLLITANSQLVLFSHLRFHCSFAWFSSLCRWQLIFIKCTLREKEVFGSRCKFAHLVSNCSLLNACQKRSHWVEMHACPFCTMGVDYIRDEAAQVRPQ